MENSIGLMPSQPCGPILYSHTPKTIRSASAAAAAAAIVASDSALLAYYSARVCVYTSVTGDLSIPVMCIPPSSPFDHLCVHTCKRKK